MHTRIYRKAAAARVGAAPVVVRAARVEPLLELARFLRVGRLPCLVAGPPHSPRSRGRQFSTRQAGAQATAATTAAPVAVAAAAAGVSTVGFGRVGAERGRRIRRGALTLHLGSRKQTSRRSRDNLQQN